MLRAGFDGLDPSRFTVHTCLERAADGDDFCTTTEETFAVNQWLHVAGVYDGNQLFVYIEGKLAASREIGAVTAYTGPAPLSIGSNRYTNHGGLGTFVGAIDEIRVWRAALSAERLAALAAAPFQLPADASELVAAYDFEQSGASPDAIVDISGAARHGTVANPTYVAGRHPGSRALYFMDNGHPVSFYPPLPDNDWVAFVPPTDVVCQWGSSCTCTGAAGKAFPVYRAEARPRLPPGAYVVCHAPAASDKTLDSSFMVQTDVTLTSTPVDPCYGIDCGRYGRCDSASATCTCVAGWTGAACDIPVPTPVPNGSSAATAAASCRELAEAYGSSRPSGLYFVTLGNAALPAWCDMTGGWTVALQYAPSVMPVPDFLAALRAGPLGGMANLGAPTTQGPTTNGLPTAYARIAREDAYTEIALGCWRAGETTPQLAALTMVPQPWIGTKLLAGAAPASSQGATTQFHLSAADAAASSLAAVFWTTADATFAVRQQGASLCGAKTLADDNQLVILVR